MRLAVLDLGTNTFHLLIADANPDKSFSTVFKTRAVVKLGQGGFTGNKIGDVPFNRGIKTILHFKELADEHRVDLIYAFATSAIRSSTNGKLFTEKIRELTGIEIKIISGDEEAKLIYYGVRQCVNLSKQPVLIMDIGGGSTEFIIADEKKIYWKQSFNIGAARLLEQFNPSDPILPREIKAVEKYLDHVLQPLEKAMKKFPVRKLVGSSGSFDTLAEMIGYRFHNKNLIRNKVFYRFDLKEYHLIHQWLLQSTTKMRMKAKGLVKMRVDMIVLSSINTNFILKKYALNEMHLSKYALKEGALWEVVKRKYEERK